MFGYNPSLMSFSSVVLLLLTALTYDNDVESVIAVWTRTFCRFDSSPIGQFADKTGHGRDRSVEGRFAIRKIFEPNSKSLITL